MQPHLQGRGCRAVSQFGGSHTYALYIHLTQGLVGRSCQAGRCQGCCQGNTRAGECKCQRSLTEAVGLIWGCACACQHVPGLCRGRAAAHAVVLLFCLCGGGEGVSNLVRRLCWFPAASKGAAAARVTRAHVRRKALGMGRTGLLLLYPAAAALASNNGEQTTHGKLPACYAIAMPAAAGECAFHSHWRTDYTLHGSALPC